ncbi:hypothetical protein CRV24_000474 [Beauveria bassiana]|nr:hypothetical protein CRV24_000474 [Beauveria bassiana]
MGTGTGTGVSLLGFARVCRCLLAGDDGHAAAAIPAAVLRCDFVLGRRRFGGGSLGHSSTAPSNGASGTDGSDDSK